MDTVEIMGKNMNLNISDPQQLARVCHALSNEQRLQIMITLQDQKLNLNEIARKLDMPVSTVGAHVSVLEQAGLIKCDILPGTRGNIKCCSRLIDRVKLDLMLSRERPADPAEEIEMPVGCYSSANGIRPTCGLVFPGGPEMDDDPNLFSHPLHHQASLIWLSAGSLEYHVPLPSRKDLKAVEISFEACSETFGHNNLWESDIFVSLNGTRIGVWRCPGDFGGRRGRHNPEFWSANNTQYGQLHLWRIDSSGTTLDQAPLSKVTLNDLDIGQVEYVSLRIGVCPEGISGGLNLFGKAFGDYPQDILIRYIFSGETP